MTGRKEDTLCPSCGKMRVVKAGFVPSNGGPKQRYQCRNCGKGFFEESLHPTLFGVDKTDPNVKLRERYLELAGMLKEYRRGSASLLQKIVERFKVQMGVKDKTVREYIEALAGTGLLTLYHGSGKWKYNPDQEWDLFRVPVEKVNERR